MATVGVKGLTVRHFQYDYANHSVLIIILCTKLQIMISAIVFGRCRHNPGCWKVVLR